MDLHYAIGIGSTEIRHARVANNHVSDPGTSNQGAAFVQVALDQRFGQTTSYNHAASSAALEPLVQRAAEQATSVSPVPWFKGYPAIEATLITGKGRTPPMETVVRRIVPVLDLCERNGITLSGVHAGIGYKGTVLTDETAHVVKWGGTQYFTSMTLHDPLTDQEARLQCTSARSTTLVPHAQQAISQLVRARDLPPGSISPGEYPVILSHHCLAHVVEFLSWYCLHGERVRKGGIYDGRIGEQVASGQFTLEDLPHDPVFPYRVPVDGFGNPKRDFTFFQEGVLQSFWEDYLSSIRDGIPHTGHGFEMQYGPGNLYLHDGNVPFAEGIKGIERGILIHDFNYTRAEDGAMGTFTGLTRHGTFLIEKGEVTARLPTLRFVESVPRLIKEISWLAPNLRLALQPEWFGIQPAISYLVPPWAGFPRFRITDVS